MDDHGGDAHVMATEIHNELQKHTGIQGPHNVY